MCEYDSRISAILWAGDVRILDLIKDVSAKLLHMAQRVAAIEKKLDELVYLMNGGTVPSWMLAADADLPLYLQEMRNIHSRSAEPCLPSSPSWVRHETQIKNCSVDDAGPFLCTVVIFLNAETWFTITVTIRKSQ